MFSRSLFLLIICPHFLFGQAAKSFYPFVWGTYSATFSNIFSSQHNQGGLAELKAFSGGVTATRRFMLKELTAYTFAVALPVASGTFCLQGKSLGYAAFRRQQAGLAYGKKLWPWLNIGIQLDYLHMHIPRYGNAHALTFETAILVHLNEHWHAGVQVFNPVKVHYKGLGDDEISSVYRAGAGYQPSKNFLLSLEATKEKDLPVMLTMIFYYHMAKVIAFTGGLTTGEEKVFLGTVLYLHRFQILLSASYHSHLGMSPFTGFVFKKNAFE